MKQKQEVWRFNDRHQLRTSSWGEINFVAHTFQKCSGAGWGWYTYGEPSIGGARLAPAKGESSSLEEAKLAVAREIRRQLAAHGVKVEIRRVSK
jgi:hypothetical protein